MSNNVSNTVKHHHEIKMNSFFFIMLSCIKISGWNNDSMLSRVANNLTSDKWGEGEANKSFAYED